MMLAPLDKYSMLLVTTHSLGALAINRSQVKDPWHSLQDGQQEVNEDGYKFGDLQESQSIDKLLSRIFGNQIGKSGKPRVDNQVFFQFCCIDFEDKIQLIYIRVYFLYLR